MNKYIQYEPLDHFAYYPFLNLFLVVACDKEDKPIGFITIAKNNEVGKFYIYPGHRGGNLVHLLIREALTVARAFGMTFLWALCFESMHRFYTRTYVKDHEMWGYNAEWVESPDERDDGQWVLVGTLPKEKDEDNNRSA